MVRLPLACRSQGLVIALLLLCASAIDHHHALHKGQSNQALASNMDNIFIDSASAEGPACPSNSVKADLSEDRTSMTLKFDKLLAIVGPELPLSERSKKCQVHVKLAFPAAGTEPKYNVLRVEYDGFVNLEKGVLASQSGNYFLRDTLPPRRVHGASFLGPEKNRDYNMHDDVPILAEGNCALSQSVTIDMDLDLVSRQGADADMEVSSLSVDRLFLQLVARPQQLSAQWVEGCNLMTCLGGHRFENERVCDVKAPPSIQLECDAERTPKALGVPSGVCKFGGTRVKTSEEIIEKQGAGCFTMRRTFTLDDPCPEYLTATAHQNVTFFDHQAPVIVFTPAPPAECTLAREPQSYGLPANVTDQCDHTPEVTLESATWQSYATVLKKWAATDSCNNTVTRVETLKLQDTQPPVLILPDSVKLRCGEKHTHTGQAIALDACAGPVNPTYVDRVAPGRCPQESIITRVWTAVDPQGLSASGEQTLNVTDEDHPVFTHIPAPATMECGMDIHPRALGFAQAEDDCGTLEVKWEDTVKAEGDCRQDRVIMRKWIAIDACGNSISTVEPSQAQPALGLYAHQVIILHDTMPPLLVPPADLELEASSTTLPERTGQPTVHDGCDPSPIVTYSDEETEGDCSPEKTINRTWTATDICGHQVQVHQIIRVVDTEAPRLWAPEDHDIECGSGAALPGGDQSLTHPDKTGWATIPQSGITPSHRDNWMHGRCRGEKILHRGWTANDECFNTVVHVQKIRIVDTIPPVYRDPHAGRPPLCLRADGGYVVFRNFTQHILDASSDQCAPKLQVTFDQCTVSQAMGERDCFYDEDEDAVYVRGTRLDTDPKGRTYFIGAHLYDFCNEPVVITKEVHVPFDAEAQRDCHPALVPVQSLPPERLMEYMGYMG